MKKILVVDDEEHILELIKYNIEQAGYDVTTVETGEEAIELLRKETFHLMLLDWMLSKMDGLEVLKIVRGDPKLKKLPVMLLTAKSDEVSKVVGLEIGADDYMSKPFSVHELLARIKALLRRVDYHKEETTTDAEEKIIIGNITLNKSRHMVIVDGHEIDLSMKEFDLLYLLANNRGIVFTRERLLEIVWGYDYCGETRTVDVHISNIRKKIEIDDTQPIYIKTIRGVGYKFQ